jgi:hypothetical protein
MVLGSEREVDPVPNVGGDIAWLIDKFSIRSTDEYGNVRGIDQSKQE